jgi:hypothetical protein
MASLQIKCVTCGHTCWTHGYVEPDTNATVFDENDPLEDGCVHMQNGEAVDTIGEEYDDEC